MLTTTRHTLTVLGAAATGGLLFMVPPDLIVPLAGLGALVGAGGYGIYRSSPALQAWAHRQLVAPRPARALASPEPRRIALPPLEDMPTLAPLPMAVPDPAPLPVVEQGQTGRLQRLPAAVAHTEPAVPPSRGSSGLPVTYHPTLWERWWSQYHPDLDPNSLAPLSSKPLFDVAQAVGRGLKATQVRLACSEDEARFPGVALGIYLLTKALSEKQHRQFAARGIPYHELMYGVTPAAAIVLGELQAEGSTEETAALPTQALPSAQEQPVQFTPPARPVLAPVTLALPYPMARVEQKGAQATIWITVGKTRSGQWYYAPCKHGVVSVSTGAGKTNVFDLIVGQLQALEGLTVDLWYGTAKGYVPIDPTDGLDRRPLHARIPDERKALGPDRLLHWLWRAAQQMHANYARMQAEPGWFPQPQIVIFDELKVYLQTYGGYDTHLEDGTKTKVGKVAENCIKDLLLLGREAGLSFIFTSQDGYCGSIQLTRGDIANLGFRAVHTTIDSNSKGNLLPELSGNGLAQHGDHDWWVATGNKGQQAQVVTVPRVSVDMMRAWGLLDQATNDQGNSDA